VSSLIFVAIQTGLRVFVVDWDEPGPDDIPNSNWRRILVANQWNRVLTVRHFNIPFTLLVFVFLIEGLHWNLIATPIPTVSLIDTGSQYVILKFTVMSFVWFAIIGIECILTKFVIWRIFGDPFESLVDLCKTSNLSLFMQSSLFHGYYINGKSNAEIDTLGKAATRIGGGHRVFETFMAFEARQAFCDLYNAMLAQTGTPSAYGLRPHLAGDIPNTVFAAYKQINDFLITFFAGKSQFLFVVQEESVMQQLVGFTPTVIADSVFMGVRPSGFRRCLFNGMQWKIQFAYLIMLICIEHASGSACIAAVIVYVIDVAIVKLSGNIGRANLASKSLLDDRLFL
jgi:meckelin